ncbi:hypothetical protein [Parabacteroides sp. FAFU027]|uniref:hypothetical protein n=1 Tax=Parabacteroides sp. FAFU027 TaxID=2922715 RepID=UPI001FB04868|nr:hypothetical protein [Parabacteroides sp. FAFU027]
MNKIFLILVFLIGLISGGCNSKSKIKEEIKHLEDTTSLARTEKKEGFDVFFNRFQKDSVFQKDRIVFPLKNLSYNTETNSFDEKMINKKEWTFTDFSKLPKKYLKSITKLSDDEFDYNIQIEDTGVSVMYIFKIYNDKWYLVVIKDEST